MSSDLEVEGELVFENEDAMKSFLKRLGASEEDIAAGKVSLERVSIEEIRKEGNRYHVRFRGKADWLSGFAPQGENPLDWLKTQVIGLVWDVSELKTLEVFRSSDELKFAFYTDEELKRKRDEYNRWWMDSASNIVGLF